MLNNEKDTFLDTPAAMEYIAQKAKLVVQVHGDRGSVFYGSTKVGTIWENRGIWFFDPDYTLRLKLSLKPTKLPMNGMIKFLQKLKDNFPQHDTFTVLKGKKPSSYQTPSLKKQAQKSLLTLVKSKYIIVNKA